jgi:hypothetical protein
MNVRTICWLTIPVAIFSVVFLTSSEWKRSVSPTSAENLPALECPNEIDLGTREIGEVAESSVLIRNIGGSDLIIDTIQTDCVCSGLVRKLEGGRGFERVNELRLGPGEVADLAVRVAIGIASQQPVKHVISFRTNDQRQPQAQIVIVIARVLGGVHAVPSEAFIGSVVVGTHVRHVLQIVDDSREIRALEKVSTAKSSRVSVRILPQNERPPVTEVTRTGSVIGAMEISVDTRVEGEIAEHVFVHLRSESAPSSIRVRGHVSPLVDFVPSKLFLPRASGNGALWSSVCICRNRSPGPYTLAVTECPPGLTVEIDGNDGTQGQQIVKVTARAGLFEGIAAESPLLIRFNVKTNGKETPLILPVHGRSGDK